MQEIWDVGHSTLTADSFWQLLKKNKIDCLVDIRRFPTSKKSPHFCQDQLKMTAISQGIEYVWLGSSLGGFRKEGYEAWMKTPEFSQGLRELESLAQQRRVALMCAEKYFGRCHRRFVLKLLSARGWTVHHILSERGKPC